MSKIGNAILLLSYLQNGRKYTISELAEKLEVSSRMIRTYKNMLEEVGFYIETIRGPYGGYIMPRGRTLPNPTLKEQDLYILKNAISKQNENKEELKRVLEKVKIIAVQNENPVEQNRDMYNLFSKAAKDHRKVQITYISKGKPKNKRIIRPYELFYYEGEWGVTAFCETKQDLRNFELKRIETAIMLEEKF